VTTPGTDGGRDATLKVWIDGKAQKVSGGKFSHTMKTGSTDKHTIVAEVVNEGGLSSGEAKDEVTANKYEPPDPKLDRESWKWSKNYTGKRDNCSTGECKYFGFTVSNLEPGKTYTMTFSDNTKEDYVSFEFTADSEGNWTLPANNYFYGFDSSTGNPLRVEIDGTQVGSAYMPR